MIVAEQIGLSRCGKKEHIDLLIKCPRRKHTSICVNCLGCLLEGVDDCGTVIHRHFENVERPKFDTIDDLNDQEFLDIPEISLDFLGLIYRISKEAENFRTIKKLIAGV